MIVCGKSKAMRGGDESKRKGPAVRRSKRKYHMWGGGCGGSQPDPLSIK